MQEHEESPSEAAAVELEARLNREKHERERRRAIQRALAAIEEAAFDASWQRGNCETAFEPFEQHDPRWFETHGARAALVGMGWQPEGAPGPAGSPPGTLNWYDRFRMRLPEYGPWLVEQRWTPLARILGDHAPTLGLEVSAILDLSPPREPARTRYLFALEKFRELVRRIDDEPFRIALGRDLGAVFTRDPGSVPWYHWPFESIHLRARGLLERADVQEGSPPSAVGKARSAQPAEKLAAASYLWAIERWQDLAPTGDSGRNYRDIYKALVGEAKESPYRGPGVPSFETWKRQVRAGLAIDEAEESA
jgi:hypothetical protein